MDDKPLGPRESVLPSRWAGGPEWQVRWAPSALLLPSRAEKGLGLLFPRALLSLLSPSTGPLAASWLTKGRAPRPAHADAWATVGSRC